MSLLRSELRMIADWIRPGSHVLDLGCGDGTLLRYLHEKRQVTGYGMEIDQDKIVKAIENNINVIQTDLDAGLSEIESGSFDYVIMSETLQAVRYPDKLIDEMLRIGAEAIITFPNFGHWRCRLELFHGRMPVTPSLPNTWYNTPNIHLCTITDFEQLCEDMSLTVLQRIVVDRDHKPSVSAWLLPNLMGEIALYRLQRQ
ncbi:methionine biosynthesis protein MetW [Thiohalophilus thiocyanatoxydans]|uniref:Methionine biosynthesis protein MetW n=1 Tax=Thiohalophilus thiocyanatoxydans TaxID=381308 RepID=A0A4R8IX73_9GAMM|nr:methionine biosynthesis protein MetW [Thiohalophilus thiocyanatoxydans]TDY04140.1 methionine biosynthesis protein MetW [Thiohalophilus thiocyanatoxydans]